VTSGGGLPMARSLSLGEGEYQRETSRWQDPLFNVRKIKMKTGIIWDPRYLKHDTGVGHPESPARLLAIEEIIKQDHSLIRLNPRMATPKEVASVHDIHLVELVSSISSSGYFDMDTPYSEGSQEAAFLAAGSVLTAIDEILSQKIDNAFNFVRPPGHHAEANRAMGFCLFNNIAIGAQYLIDQGHSKIAIVDFDVHHGNGTQHIFYDRKDVFYISTHQFPFYPGTGSASEKGRGDGFGYTLNIPLQAASDDDDFKKNFQEKIIPALLDYSPNFILVSAGYDAHVRDPLGGLNLTAKGFLLISRELCVLAKKICQGRILFVLEGGYDRQGLQEGVEASLTALCGL